MNAPSSQADEEAVTEPQPQTTPPDALQWDGGDLLRQRRRNELIDYLWGAPRPPDVLVRTPGFAICGAREETAFPAPVPLPLGLIVLYAKFLVFVSAGPRPGWTSNESDPARAAAGWIAMLGDLTPVRVPADAYSRLSESNRARLHEPLLRRDSIVVPVAKISDVRSARCSEMPCIEVLTPSQVLWIGPHPEAGSHSVTAATRWEPRLHALLVELGAGRRP